jgi:hypothetical protein
MKSFLASNNEIQEVSGFIKQYYTKKIANLNSQIVDSDNEEEN